MTFQGEEEGAPRKIGPKHEKRGGVCCLTKDGKAIALLHTTQHGNTPKAGEVGAVVIHSEGDIQFTYLGMWQKSLECSFCGDIAAKAIVSHKLPCNA